MGDINEILWSWKKKGGNSSNTPYMEDFRSAVSELELHDLGFIGHNFTWSNGREGDTNVQVRLDRAFANLIWRVFFS